jgi:hypothetical protein
MRRSVAGSHSEDRLPVVADLTPRRISSLGLLYVSEETSVCASTPVEAPVAVLPVVPR